jgi:flagellar biosynthetic protein FliQ
MSPESAVDIFTQALTTALLIASPMLGVGLVVGLLIGVLQAVTQVHEMTLTFVPKMIGVVVVLLVALPWMLQLMLGYTTSLFQSIAGLG